MYTKNKASDNLLEQQQRLHGWHDNINPAILTDLEYQTHAITKEAVKSTKSLNFTNEFVSIIAT